METTKTLNNTTPKNQKEKKPLQFSEKNISTIQIQAHRSDK